MNIHLEKIELMERLLEVEDSAIIKQLKSILLPKKQNETDRIVANPELARKITEARQEIKDGKGVKMDVKNLWK